MNAQEAYHATQKGLMKRAENRQATSKANLDKLLNVIIPIAANLGYGSVHFERYMLLDTEHEALKAQGYKVRFRSGGDYGTDTYQVIWDRKSPKQGMWKSNLTDDQQLESLPNQ